MSILNIFSSASEKAFAKEMIARLVKEIPPALMESRRKVLSVNKVTRLLERTFQMAAEYQQEHKSGFVKRAVLANCFKWELKGANYPEDFVNLATEGLIVTLSKASKKAKSP
jgi:hypothetical protein